MPAKKDHQEPPLSASDVERVIAVLSRDDVRHALLSSTSMPVPLESIPGLPAPAGLTHEQTLDLLTTLQRLPATYSPIPDREGRMYWFVHTNRIRLSLSTIDQHCTVHSRLYERIMSRSGARFVVQSNVDETAATARLDHVDIDYETAKELLLTKRQPRTVEERLIVNHYRLSEELQDLVDMPWTPTTLMDLYGRLTYGIPSKLSRSPHGANRSAEDGAFRGLCSYAESAHLHSCTHPAEIALIVRAVTTYWNLFPAWNGMMSRILFRFVALKLGYPVLGYLPLSHSELMLREARPDWPPTLAPEPAVLGVWKESNTTPWLDSQLSLMVHALRQLDARMGRAAHIDEAVQGELQADVSMNHRQRSVIGRALRLPDATFRIGYHRTTHGIGYATAHRDFAELVARGYLAETREGRMKVFRAGPALEERIGALADVGRIEDYEIPLPPEFTSVGT
ncbi:MAG: Fic family protein [Coriobacteriia bacterium]